MNLHSYKRSDDKNGQETNMETSQSALIVQFLFHVQTSVMFPSWTDIFTMTYCCGNILVWILPHHTLKTEWMVDG